MKENSGGITLTFFQLKKFMIGGYASILSRLWIRFRVRKGLFDNEISYVISLNVIFLIK
jgi:hypothetical protein